jgi:hypothetical protein
MGIIKDRFKAKADSANVEIKGLLKEHGSKKIGEVTLSQIYAGMRGITGLVTETSLLDAPKVSVSGAIQFLSCRRNFQKQREEMNRCLKDYFT